MKNLNEQHYNLTKKDNTWKLNKQVQKTKQKQKQKNNNNNNNKNKKTSK